MQGAGGKSWFTPAELAALELPGLSRAKRKINERADKEGWALRVDAAGMPLARPRQGRGGGLVYHLQLLPAAARTELIRRGLAEQGAEVVPSPRGQTGAEHWAWYESQSDGTKAEARRRAEIVAAVEEFECAGLTRSAAIACTAARFEVASSTIWAWLSLIAGIEQANRLPHLAPRRTGGGAEAEVDAGAWSFIVSDYLRPEQPTWASCYRRLREDYAAPRGIELPHMRTLWRKLEREVDGRLIIARRQGADALRRTLPPQQRTVAGMRALELVNIDGHKWDVFVRFPDGRIGRPMMVAIQDVYSRKILAWRLAESENSISVRLAFADLFQKWGIPDGCVLDNGRAFASKWITGGAKSRFRFKIRDEEPTGILTALGIQIHWTHPYRGQSKPIERAFRDLCDAVAKHPALAGAYTGNRPDAKPENYGDRAIELDAFRLVVNAGIAAHNAQPGRRTEIARGRSFDEVFAESYMRCQIGKASAEQLRLALLTADEISTHRESGAITLHQNRYWSDQLVRIAGRKVTVRFDPDDLTLPLYVYDREGRFLAEAPLLEQTGFLDVASAKKRARQEADLRKAIRAATAAEQLLGADELAALIPAHPDEDAPIAPTVIRPVRHRGATAAALKPVSEAAEAPPSTAFIDRFEVASRRLRVVE